MATLAPPDDGGEMTPSVRVAPELDLDAPVGVGVEFAVA